MPRSTKNGNESGSDQPLDDDDPPPHAEVAAASALSTNNGHFTRREIIYLRLKR
jgi:hypothetical protein